MVAVDDRKMFIATGYGMEEFVPDILAVRIVDRTLAPNFRQGEFYKGLDEATSILMSLLSGQFVAEPNSGDISIGTLVLITLFFFLIVIIISWISRRGKGGKGGGLFPDSRTLGNPYRRGSTWTDFNSGGGSFGGGFGSGSGGSFGGFGGGSFGGGGAGGSW